MLNDTLQFFKARIVPSVDVIHGWRSVIRGCHPWIQMCHSWMEKCHLWMSSMDGEMSSMDDIQGWRQRMADMDGAFFKQLRIITKTFIQGNNMCPD